MRNSNIKPELLTESKQFCMLPWIHLHSWPTGEAFPCCMSGTAGQIGNTKTQTMKEVWNSNKQKQLRLDMINGVPNAACTKCYERENAGFKSVRNSANFNHKSKFPLVLETQDDGHLEKFELSYWDIRFSNLCNLKCRSCGPTFSTTWHSDNVALLGEDWAKRNPILTYAGRTKTDMLDQLLEHLDYVEQIYFAGGEPLIMEEHYIILDELVKRKKFNVILNYNTNFTQLSLKNKHVLDYWKQFDTVFVGASLDASYERAAYIRHGTNWKIIEANRRLMIQECPGVQFKISSTLSIMNALHIPDFHKEWVELNLITPQDATINVLQDAQFFRIDIAPPAYKAKIQAKYEEHIRWLEKFKVAGYIITAFQSSINYMNATDNSHLIPKCIEVLQAYDKIRNEDYLTAIPELLALSE